MGKIKREVRRYSEAFKLQVVNEIEEGKVSGFWEVQRKYGIKGGNTVRRWLVKFGRDHLLNKIVRVETMRERDRVKKLQDEVSRLKHALADAHLDLRIERARIEILGERAGVTDVDAFKKKLDSRPFTKRPLEERI